MFQELSFLPLPLLDATKEHYRKFDDLFGQPLNERGRLSYIPTPTEEAKQKEKGRKTILVKAKVGESSLVKSAEKCDVYSQSS